MKQIAAILAVSTAIAMHSDGATAAEAAKARRPDQMTMAVFMARAEAAFLRIDRNRDGVIDREEMKHAKARRLDRIMENHKKRDSHNDSASDRKERRSEKD